MPPATNSHRGSPPGGSGERPAAVGVLQETAPDRLWEAKRPIALWNFTGRTGKGCGWWRWRRVFEV